MRIPDRLRQKLEQYPELHAGVLASITHLQPWIATNSLPFFPEYTDHGITHLESVLATAESLIRDEAWFSFTPADAAALTLAVVLHDSAMHLSEDGFAALVRHDTEFAPMRGFGDKPWPVMWQDFLSEARRFDGRKLLDLFGDPRPIRIPPMDPDEMNRKDRLLIGEFLRRAHHRLAHEIALNGVPGPARNRLGLREVPAWLADLSGHVARSHGLPLRECLSYLDTSVRL